MKRRRRSGFNEIFLRTEALHRITVSVSLALLLLTTSCGRRSSLSEGFRILYERPSPNTALSDRVILVADNQIHNLYGEPIWMRSEFTAKIVRTALRPVQLDLYGTDLMRWMLARPSSAEPIIHLGDADDFSCTQEFETFLHVMAEAKRVWVMVPGNHDGYLFGNVGTWAYS